jgi:hypothetical protein
MVNAICDRLGIGDELSVFPRVFYQGALPWQVNCHRTFHLQYPFFGGDVRKIGRVRLDLLHR